jgi:hypothetical protein
MDQTVHIQNEFSMNVSQYYSRLSEEFGYCTVHISVLFTAIDLCAIVNNKNLYSTAL